MFARHERLPASVMQEQLLTRNVAVRRFPGTPTDNFLRFTVSALSGTDRLMACLDEIVSASNETHPRMSFGNRENDFDEQ
ncbi:MAG: hypothetical protein P1U77_26645 [Rubripirellula sp.]|nr:hypothetical protein [Rubripirellula sp.]